MMLVLDKPNPISTHSPGSGQLLAPALAIPFGKVLFSPTTSPSVSLEHNIKLAAAVFIINPSKKINAS